MVADAGGLLSPFATPKRKRISREEFVSPATPTAPTVKRPKAGPQLHSSPAPEWLAGSLQSSCQTRELNTAWEGHAVARSINSSRAMLPGPPLPAASRFPLASSSSSRSLATTSDASAPLARSNSCRSSQTFRRPEEKPKPTPMSRHLLFPTTGRGYTTIPSTESIMRTPPRATYNDMPTEVLRLIHIFSGSDDMRFVNKHTFYSLSGIHYLAHWCMCVEGFHGVNAKKEAGALDRIVARPVCTRPVLEKVLELWERRAVEIERCTWQRRSGQRTGPSDEGSDNDNGSTSKDDQPSTPRPRPIPPKVRALPRRLLRTPKDRTGVNPMVRWLVEKYDIDLNGDQCFAIKRAALDNNHELVEFLLRHGAKVTGSGNKCFKAAILNKDLRMLKLLVEQPDAPNKTGVLTKQPDRLAIPREVVNMALEEGAKDIVMWLVDEKGVMPSLDVVMKQKEVGTTKDTDTGLRAQSQPKSRPKSKSTSRSMVSRTRRS